MLEIDQQIDLFFILQLINKQYFRTQQLMLFITSFWKVEFNAANLYKTESQVSLKSELTRTNLYQSESNQNLK